MTRDDDSVMDMQVCETNDLVLRASPWLTIIVEGGALIQATLSSSSHQLLSKKTSFTCTEILVTKGLFLQNVEDAACENRKKNRCIDSTTIRG